MKISLAVVLAALGLSLALTACGGGGDRLLTLHSGEVSEDDYRTSLRTSMLGLGAVSQCVSLRGLSGKETFEALANAQANASSVPDVDLSRMSAAELEDRLATLEALRDELTALATVAVSDDGARAGEIIQEECARILND